MISRKSIALVQVYYDRLNSRSYTETPAYTIAELAADFGGMVGIILGLSVITFLELFYGLLGICIYALKNGEVSIM